MWQQVLSRLDWWNLTIKWATNLLGKQSYNGCYRCCFVIIVIIVDHSKFKQLKFVTCTAVFWEIQILIIWLEARLKPNIALLWSTIGRWCVRPKVNRFQWNLEHSEYIVWAGPGRFWARSMQKREQESLRKFFCQVNNARLRRFPVSHISRNLHTAHRSVKWWILSEQSFENFPARGRLSKKTQKVGTFVEVLRFQASVTPQLLQVDENSLPNDPSRDV